MYRVYVIQSEAGKFYVGLSEDIHRRLLDHNEGLSKWAKGKGPWHLIWSSDSMTLSDARKLENHIKRQGRGRGFYQIIGLSYPGS